MIGLIVAVPLGILASVVSATILAPMLIFLLLLLGIAIIPEPYWVYILIGIYIATTLAPGIIINLYFTKRVAVIYRAFFVIIHLAASGTLLFLVRNLLMQWTLQSVAL